MSERGQHAIVFGVSVNVLIKAVVDHYAPTDVVLRLGRGLSIDDAGNVSVVTIEGRDGDPAHVAVDVYGRGGLPWDELTASLGCAAWVNVFDTAIGVNIHSFCDRGVVLVEEGSDPDRVFFTCPLVPAAAPDALTDEPTEEQRTRLRVAADAAVREHCPWGAALLAARDGVLDGTPLAAQPPAPSDDDIPW